jgi:hypothetical protein
MTTRPTEIRLRPPTGQLQGKPAVFDPTQLAEAAAYAVWPAPLDHLAVALFTAYYGIPNPDVDPFVSQDTVKLGRYLAERHQA